jgi:hypothetical protein
MEQHTSTFRLRLREWLATHMPRQDGPARTGSDRDPARHRLLQRRLFDGGYAGLTYPAAYGGQGLTAEYQEVFREETAGYELPTLCNVSLGILGPTILDFGTEEQKRRHLPAILRGDELWVQLLSEPAGGSDLAGCITRATRDGDQWVLNGSKIWSTGAHFSDYALCLARSNWSLPKHRGLTMFAIELHQPGIDIEPIRQANGDAEFCQEFITDLAIDGHDMVGAENAGWEVAGRLLYHERNLAGAASPYTYGSEAESTPVAPTAAELVDVARSSGTTRRISGSGRSSPRRTRSTRFRPISSSGSTPGSPWLIGTDTGRCSACSRSPRCCSARRPAWRSRARSSPCGLSRRAPAGWAASS